MAASVEAFAGKHHGGADGGTAEHAEHHAEAVIERHRNAKPVLGRQRHRFRGVARIIDDVEMGQRRSFGRAGCAAGELDVDRVVRVERGGQRLEAAAVGGPGERHQAGEGPGGARQRSFAEDDDVAQVRKPRRPQRSRAVIELGSERAQHVHIVARLVAAGEDQRLAADLVERVFKLGDAISRIDVDQDGTDACSTELHIKPLGAIGRPDADAIATADAEREEAGGNVVRSRAQVVPRQPYVGVGEDRRGTAAEARAGPVQQLRNGHELERIVGRAGNIGTRSRRPQAIVAVAAQKVRAERVVAVCRHRRPPFRAD
jgi:hypothetical protein